MTRALFTLLAAALAAAPVRAQQSPSARPQGNTPLQSEEPKTPYDSTVAAISDIGTKVAEVRSAYELYRRAAFNSPDGAVLQRAQQYEERCHALAVAVREAQPRVRTSTVGSAIRPSIQQYHAYLPTLARVADQCASRIRLMRARRTDLEVARTLRDGARGEGTRLSTDLRVYEARLREVRHAMGWDQRGLVPTARPGR